MRCLLASLDVGCLFDFVNFAISLSLCYHFIFFQLLGCAVASDVAYPFCASSVSDLAEVGVSSFMSEVQQRLATVPLSALTALVYVRIERHLFQRFKILYFFISLFPLPQVRM